MKDGAKFFTILLISASFCIQCISSTRSVEPEILIHYLGHSSFILQFDNGIKVLTDYGVPRAYDLNSPIYDLGALQPEIVTYSHLEHADHYGGRVPDNVSHVLKNLDSLELKGIKIKPVRTSELSLETKDNTSYIFRYKGITIVHLGDAQANIKNMQRQENRSYLREIFPDTIDLLLMTIGGRSNIIQQAEAFIDLLRPEMVIPMHYWNREDKIAFLSFLERQNGTKGKQYQIKEIQSAKYSISNFHAGLTPIQVISLEPAPYSQPELKE